MLMFYKKLTNTRTHDLSFVCNLLLLCKHNSLEKHMYASTSQLLSGLQYIIPRVIQFTFAISISFRKLATL